MLEGRTFGIFDLLDEECRMPNPNVASFMQKVQSNHRAKLDFSSNRSLNSCFVIQHFGHKVQYTTVRKYFY